MRYPVRIDIFVNGEHLDTLKSIRSLQNTIPYHIGSFYDNKYPFIGCLASVMVYNTALSGTDIADLARYRRVLGIDENERLFFKLRPEVLSERIGQSSHLLGVSIV